MSRTTSAALVALVLACGTAQASKWVFVVEAANGKGQVFIDTQSIRIDGNIRRAWFKSVYAPHSVPDPPGSGRYSAYNVTRAAFNCSEETSRVEAITIYYEDGSNPKSMPPSQFPTAWEQVPPDTISAVDMAFICVWKP